ncbi:aquaporin Z [Clavibacter californiensis]|uniref:Aquaporin Z n=1 Tax=Clavibacter californiensis TaxID=1401995 RepID=A0ABX9NB79_9MICO|nr:aquaporin Z [Clavibacter californiensis]RII94765.1 aquaporin Z [Clavibacter californiensis]UKF80830.1 aquaporin Z [Clavibacter californiensis]
MSKSTATTKAPRDTPAQGRGQKAASAGDRPSAAARWGAEAFGTFLLVFGGVGTALYASAFPDVGNATGVGFLGVALAFGLTVMAGVAAVGGISGGHFNPAVSVGLAFARRIGWREVPGYVVAQLVGGILGSSALALIASDGPAGYLASKQDAGFASNGFGGASPGGFGLGAVLLVEVILTAVFVTVILAVTGQKAYAAVAPIVIGLTLTLIHLISIPVSNTSVNPARSIAAAIYGGPVALGQVWAFIVAPLVGAAIAGLAHRALARAADVPA